MDIQQISRRTEVQVLAVFGVLVLGGFYIYRKRFVDSTRWAKAAGRTPRPPKGFTCPRGYRIALVPNIIGIPTWTCISKERQLYEIPTTTPTTVPLPTTPPTVPLPRM